MGADTNTRAGTSAMSTISAESVTKESDMATTSTASKGPKGNQAQAARIASHYRRQILTAAMRPGDGLPPGVVMAQEWNVSKETADAAMKVLKEEGLINADRKGRTVAERPLGSVLTLPYPEGLTDAQKQAWAGLMVLQGEALVASMLWLIKGTDDGGLTAVAAVP